MIQANELRIGNWVSFSGQHHVVEGLNGKSVRVHTNGHRSGLVNYKSVEPIPLTPEILEKCGFKKDGVNWYNNNSVKGDEVSEPSYDFIQEGDGFSYFVQSDYYGSNSITITSLHQLQNLYFALTGNELNYKP